LLARNSSIATVTSSGSFGAELDNRRRQRGETFSSGAGVTPPALRNVRSGVFKPEARRRRRRTRQDFPYFHDNLGSKLGSAEPLVVLAGSALGTTRTVTSLNDSGAGSLRDTIAASASGDTIVFAVTGTIVLTSSSLDVNHDLTILGPGASSLTIARQSTSNFRIFYFDNGT
jgi:hypothetical protein